MLLLCWFDHFLDYRAEICQIFRRLFGKSMTPKKHSEINWPLDLTSASQWPMRLAGHMTNVALDRMEFLLPFLFNQSSFSLCSSSSWSGFPSKISFCFRIKLISRKVLPKPMSSAKIPPGKYKNKNNLTIKAQLEKSIFEIKIYWICKI